VIFDAGNDMWAYGYMKGWHVSEHIDFAFADAHDLEPLTHRAEDEAYIKGKLRERFRASKQAIVLVGPGTKYLTSSYAGNCRSRWSLTWPSSP
jgi:hypothetical protein